MKVTMPLVSSSRFFKNDISWAVTGRTGGSSNKEGQVGTKST